MSGPDRRDGAGVRGTDGFLGDRRGLTLVELLVVAVLGAVIVGAVYQILATNQRVYTVQQEQIQAQQTVRSGLEVLSAEVRALSIPEGDLVSMDDHRMEVRVPRTLGLVCQTDVDGDERTFLVRPEGRPFREGERVMVFAQNDPSTTTDDRWLDDGGRVDSVEDELLPLGCDPDPLGGTSGQIVEVGGMGTLIQANQVHPGAPMRTFERFRYGLFEIDGVPYLGRRDLDDGDEEHPLVGPVRPDDGVLFEYLDRTGDPASSTDEVARIRVSIRTESGATGPSGEALSDSLSVTIHPRN